jgi:hypothetical protein
VEGQSLSAVCGVAFGVVAVVLAFLALVIHLVTLVFPAPSARTDAAIVAAIAAAVTARYPGARVVGIEEAP